MTGNRIQSSAVFLSPVSWPFNLLCTIRSSYPNFARCWPVIIAPNWKSFARHLNPGRTAEFMEGLSDDEAWQVLQYAEPHRRSEIFSYFDEERQLAMLAMHDAAQVAELIEELPPDDRVDLLARVTARTCRRNLAAAAGRRSSQYPDGCSLTLMGRPAH